jgi:short-subunit dehydrogenase
VRFSCADSSCRCKKSSASGRLDIVINNAGVGITGPLEEIPSEEIFETNLFGPIEVMKAALPQMRTQKSGLIINITSIAGYMGLPYRSIYSASKGFRTNNRGSSHVKSFGIHITNVAPGDFATNIASGRYHAPVIRALLMRFLMESHCERWMSMSMEVVIQMKWLKLFIKLFKLKNLEYIIK